uniref:Uncharacterized protein n=1 Tax=Quercus lobata TaxID=97700 RepID=A0A7N2RDG1_QUELO
MWMCEVCEQAPASVTCNFDIHSANPLAHRHKHVPVEPFFDTAESVIKSGAPLTNFLVVPTDHNESPEASWMKLGYGEERKWVLVGFWRSNGGEGEGGSHGG